MTDAAKRPRAPSGAAGAPAGDTPSGAAHAPAGDTPSGAAHGPAGDTPSGAAHGPAGDDDALRHELIGAFRAYQRSVDTLDDLVSRLMGINRTDARVIDLLEERGSLTAGEIAAGAGLTSGAVTGVIDRLERAGYARRVADPEDRRRVRVEPTERVMQVAAELYGGMAAKGAAVFGAYSRDELRLVARALRDATALTDEHVAELREHRAGDA